MQEGMIKIKNVGKAGILRDMQGTYNQDRAK